MRLNLALLLILACTLSAEDQPYRYFLSGNPADASVRTEPGFLLAGGGADVDQAFRWFLDKAGQGDIVILRASGADGYHAYLAKLGHPDSIETFVFLDKQASSHPTVLEKLKQADGIFLAGGDQWNYFRFWKGTPVEDAIHAAAARGVPIGGTSAGLAVLGQYSFAAQHDTVTSATALADPFHEKVSIGADFLSFPSLACLITDSHFTRRDRMGRLLVFLARIRQESTCATVKAIGVDERTAVLLAPNAKPQVAGEESAFFLTLGAKPDIRRARPATIPAIQVQRIDASGAGANYILRVDKGAIHSSLPSGSPYR
ncbi:MAG: cyanophycinase [Bryobacterales bacterium]|nr:cyanophycinase [Bryobacterales bacterium]